MQIIVYIQYISSTTVVPPSSFYLLFFSLSLLHYLGVIVAELDVTRSELGKLANTWNPNTREVRGRKIWSSKPALAM